MLKQLCSAFAQGPPNPDVFQMPNDNEVPLLLEEIVKEGKIVQEEILFMLNQVNDTCTYLTILMERVCSITNT